MLIVEADANWRKRKWSKFWICVNANVSKIMMSTNDNKSYYTQELALQLIVRVTRALRNFCFRSIYSNNIYVWIHFYVWPKNAIVMWHATKLLLIKMHLDNSCFVYFRVCVYIINIHSICAQSLSNKRRKNIWRIWLDFAFCK